MTGLFFMQIEISPPPEGCRVVRLVDHIKMEADEIYSPAPYNFTSRNQLLRIESIPIDNPDQYRFNF